MGGEELPRFGHEYRPDPAVCPPADGAPERLLDSILNDVVVLILVGTEIPYPRRETLAEKPVHHHVRILGIHPDAHVLDAVDGAGFVPDEQAFVFLELVTDRRKRERSAPRRGC